MIEVTKNQPFKKNHNNKEIVIEITGLNNLLIDKFNREEKKYNMVSKLNKDMTNLVSDQVHPKQLTHLELNSNQIEQHHDHAHTMHAVCQHPNIDIKIELPSVDIEETDYDTAKKLNTMGLPLKSLKEGIQTIEDYLTQTVKNKPFFYFTPVIIQFSNPSLIPYDLCYLCGSYGYQQDLVVCSTCQEAYHYFCISKAYADPAKYSRIKTMLDWNCPKCKQCQKCHKKSETHNCLICETCDNLYHLNCVYPQVNILFPSYWKCEQCFKCTNCGRNKIFIDNLSIANNIIYHEFCEDFKWCYECGLKLAYFKFCKICKKYCQKSISKSNPYDDKKRSLQYINPQEDSIECKQCSFKYHISCYEEEFYPIKNYESLICYNCQISDYDPQKMEEEILNKIQDIQNRKKNIRKLVTISESIFNHYDIAKIDQTLRENFYKFLASFIIEEYDTLVNNQYVKIMLQNFELMNEATRLLVPKLSQNKSTITSYEKREVISPSNNIQEGYAKSIPILCDFIEWRTLLETNIINLIQVESLSGLNSFVEEIEALQSINMLEKFQIDINPYSADLVKYFNIGRLSRFVGEEFIFPVFEDSILQIPFLNNGIEDYLKSLLQYKIRQENIENSIRNQVKKNKMLWRLLENNDIYFEKDYLSKFITFNSVPVLKDSLDISITKFIQSEDFGPKSIIVDCMVYIPILSTDSLMRNTEMIFEQTEQNQIQSEKSLQEYDLLKNLLENHNRPKEHNEFYWSMEMIKAYYEQYSIANIDENEGSTPLKSGNIQVNKDLNEEDSQSNKLFTTLINMIF